MKNSSFTDLFIRKPVLALVVNMVIVIAGIQSWRSLSVRQLADYLAPFDSLATNL